MKTSFRRCRSFLAIGMVLALSGCVNLDDVCGLGKIADQMRSSLPQVAADIPATCERQKALIANIPDNEKGPITADDCRPYADLAQHLSEDQAVLIAYLDALSKLSSNAPLSYDKNIDTNVATIASYTNLSTHASAAATAAQKITRILADAATHGYREKKVNEIIISTNDPIQELAAALKQAVTVDYAIILSNEGQVLSTFYETPMASRKGERLTLILVQRQYDGDKIALANRLAAAKAYGQVMDDLASTHDKLAKAAAKHASLTQIAKDLGPDIASLKDALSDLVAKEK